MSYQSGLRVLLRREAADWAYGVGLPRYQAEAFGEWFVEKYGTDPRWRPTWSEAKIAFDHDPRGHEIVQKHGAKAEHRCKHCGEYIFASESTPGAWLCNDMTSFFCGHKTHADPDAQMHEPKETP